MVVGRPPENKRVACDTQFAVSTWYVLLFFRQGDIVGCSVALYTLRQGESIGCCIAPCTLRQGERIEYCAVLCGSICT